MKNLKISFSCQILKKLLRETAGVPQHRSSLSWKVLPLQLLIFCSSLFSLFLPSSLVVCVKLFYVAGRFQASEICSWVRVEISWFRLEEGIYFIFRKILSMWNLSEIALEIKFCHVWLKDWVDDWQFLLFLYFSSPTPSLQSHFEEFFYRLFLYCIWGENISNEENVTAQ